MIRGAGWKEGLLKIAAIFSYCGGPLFLVGVLKRQQYPGTAAFWLTFLPVAAMIMGAQFIGDDVHGRMARGWVWLGRLGLYIALGMHAYAVWCFANGVRVPDQRLHYLGIVVGLAWSFAYLRAARRWTASPDAPDHAPDRASSEPIEPS